MSNRKDEDRFIEKLLEETYQVNSSNEDGVSPSYEAFKKQYSSTLEDFVREYSIPFIYQERVGCYRLKWRGYVLDFPANWSFFQETSRDFVIIDQLNNCDNLFDVFKHLDSTIKKIIFQRDEEKLSALLVDTKNLIEWEQVEEERTGRQQAA